MHFLSLIDYLIRRNHQHLILHVTSKCNLRCSHCFVVDRAPPDMPLEAFQALAREVGHLNWLDIGGGEPLLRDDLADIVCSFRANLVQIPSNGMCPDELIEQCKRIQQRSGATLLVSLSVDGLPDTHDAIRNRQGSWRQVWDTFEKLRSCTGIRAKINTCIHTANFHEIIPLMQEVRRRDPDFHSIILLRGDPPSPKIVLPPLEDLEQIGPEIFSILSSYNFRVGRIASHLLHNYYKTLWNVSLRILKERRQVIPCLAGRTQMVVWADGRVSSCEMLPPVGNLRSQTWEEILSSQECRDQIEDIRNKRCFCTHNCALLDSILYSPRQYGNLLHQRVRHG